MKEWQQHAMDHENFPAPVQSSNETPATSAAIPSESAAEVSGILEAAVPLAPEAPPSAVEPTESFADLLSEFEQEHQRPAENRQVEATVVSVSTDTVYLDIGFKVEGVLLRTAFENNADEVKPGDKVHGLDQGPQCRGVLRAVAL